MCIKTAPAPSITMALMTESLTPNSLLYGSLLYQSIKIMPATGIEPVLYCYNRILSPARLPVPPRGHFSSIPVIIPDETKWAEVDSNHRSNLQQIYSLSPLATRESAHFTGHPADTLTIIYFTISIRFFQVISPKKLFFILGSKSPPIFP